MGGPVCLSGAQTHTHTSLHKCIWLSDFNSFVKHDGGDVVRDGAAVDTARNMYMYRDFVCSDQKGRRTDVRKRTHTDKKKTRTQRRRRTFTRAALFHCVCVIVFVLYNFLVYLPRNTRIHSARRPLDAHHHPPRRRPIDVVKSGCCCMFRPEHIHSHTFTCSNICVSINRMATAFGVYLLISHISAAEISHSLPRALRRRRERPSKGIVQYECIAHNDPRVNMAFLCARNY